MKTEGWGSIQEWGRIEADTVVSCLWEQTGQVTFDCKVEFNSKR